jgi:hypothetical protein
MCYYYSCSWNCCNYWGTCPENYAYSYSWQYNSCYTYYSKSTTTTVNAGVIAGAVVGAVVGLILLIALSCYCYRRRQQQLMMQQQAMMNNNNPNGTINTLIINQPQYPSYPPAGNNFSANYGSPIYGGTNNNAYLYNGQTAGNNQYGQPVNPFAKGF